MHSDQVHNYRGFAITSIIAGPVTVALVLYVFFVETMAALCGIDPASRSPDIQNAAYFFYLAFLVSWVGLVSGFIGLRSSKRKPAIAGMIICALVIAITLLSLLGTDYYGFYIFY
jgi:hypothetical protein